MKLKEGLNAVDFLERVKKCSSDVWLETDDGDRLNLKSVLSQYVFVVLSEQKNILKAATLSCEQDDAKLLEEFLSNAA